MLARDHRLNSGSNVAIDGIARCIMYAQAIAKSLHDAAKVVLQQRWSEFFDPEQTKSGAAGAPLDVRRSTRSTARVAAVTISARVRHHRETLTS
jgi:hypothetical protein